MLATGLHVLIETTSAGGAPRAVSSFQISDTVDFEATPLVSVAYGVLGDVADEVTTYVHRPWPTNDSGVALHAWAGTGDGVIQLAFRGAGANAGATAIELPPFPVPPKPVQTIPVG
ncbi:MAG: hypothetical protein M3Z25_04455 [Actinomycetota bacterium]|nr:hypothetical protein [Actinomycetota bacterium]